MPYLVKRTFPELLGVNYKPGDIIPDEVVAQCSNPRTIKALVNMGRIEPLAASQGEYQDGGRRGRPRKEV